MGYKNWSEKRKNMLDQETCVYIITEVVTIKDYNSKYKEKWKTKYNALDFYDELSNEEKSTIETVAVGIIQEARSSYSGNAVLVYNEEFCIEHSCEKTCFTPYNIYYADQEDLYMCGNIVFCANDIKEAQEKTEYEDGNLLQFCDGGWVSV